MIATIPKQGILEDMNYSDAIGENLSGCGLQFPFDKAKREQCQADWNRRNADKTELERIRLQNEQLALQTAAGQEPMSAGQIALITLVTLGALTGMVIAIKKFGK